MQIFTQLRQLYMHILLLAILNVKETQTMGPAGMYQMPCRFCPESMNLLSVMTAVLCCKDCLRLSMFKYGFRDIQEIGKKTGTPS